VRFFALGAEGVQVGTRFLASDESPTGEQWKKAIVEYTDDGTERHRLQIQVFRVDDLDRSLNTV